MKSLSVTIQMEATEQYFPVVLFIMLYKMVLSFEMKSNESYWAVLSFSASSVLCCDELLSNNFFLWFSEKTGDIVKE